MANLNALKNLFSKLKPAAKTIANYGDDVAGVVANYGDDAAKALTTYGDDVARMTFANTDDLAAATAQSDDIAKLISDADIPTDPPSAFNIFYTPENLIDELSEPKMNLSQISNAASSRTPNLKTAPVWDDIHRKLSNTSSSSPAQQVAKQVYPYTSSGLGEAADRAYDNYWLRKYEGHGAPEAWATDYLGEVVAGIDPIEGHVSEIIPTADSVPLAQWLPIDSLVGDVSVPPNFESVYPNGKFMTTLRPHKNTALGRWYASKLK